MEDIEIETPYQSSTLEKLNKKTTKGYRPSREHLNAYTDELRQDIKDNIQKDNRVIWKNLSQRERSALHRLNKNKDIAIKAADKGGTTVIMDSSEYFKEATRQLQNEQYYQKVERDEQAINQSTDQLVEKWRTRHRSR